MYRGDVGHVLNVAALLGDGERAVHGQEEVVRQSEFEEFVNLYSAARRWAKGGTELKSAARLDTRRDPSSERVGRLAGSQPQLRDLRSAAPLFFPWIVAIVVCTVLVISILTFVVVLVVRQTRQHLNAEAV